MSGTLAAQQDDTIEQFACYVSETTPSATTSLDGITIAFSRHLEAGGLWRGRGNYRLAIAHYRCAIDINPTSATAYYGLGMSQAGQQLYDNALLNLDAALEVAPQYAPYHVARAEVLYHLNLIDPARLALAQAEQYDATLPDIAYLHGLLHLQLGESDDALEQFMLAIERGYEPRRLPQLQIAEIYFKRRDVYQVNATLREIMTFDSEYVQAQLQLADYYRELGERDEARAAYFAYMDDIGLDEDVRAFLYGDIREQLERVTRYLPSLLLVLLSVYIVGVPLWRVQRYLRQQTKQAQTANEMPGST